MWPFNKPCGKAKVELELIEQFVVTLRATFLQVKIKNPSATPEILEKIEKLLQVASWQNAYEIERLLVEIYDGNTLDVEVDRRLVEIQTNLSENVSSHYAKKVDEIPKVDDTTPKETKISIADKKRSILNRMINDSQWNFAIKETKRKYSREISTNNGLAILLSTVIFVLTIGFGNFLDWEGNLYYLAVSLSAGLVGASFSMVVTSRSRLAGSSFDELKVQRLPINVVTRSLIGLGAALILYFFLQAELLTGSIFPNFTPPAFLASGALDAKDTLAGEIQKFLESNTPLKGEELQTKTSKLTNRLRGLAGFSPFLDFKNLALLIVWSILAGFSEKFVPNLLAKTEEKATVKSF